MELDVIEKQPKFYKQIKEALNKGFLSHSYLIESVNLRDEQVNKYIHFFVKTIYDNYYDDNISISKEKIFHLVDNLEFPDYIEIRPVNNVIKKEQLLRVRDDFSNKSLYNTKKIYTVYNADKMNVNSSNTILKFSPSILSVCMCSVLIYSPKKYLPILLGAPQPMLFLKGELALL